MGLFGDIDATDIPDNPFYVAPGTYESILAEAKTAQTKDGSKDALAFKWVIEDEDSEYNGQNVSDWLTIYPDVTKETLTPEIRSALSRVKDRLTQMGLSVEDQDTLLEDGNLEALIGLRANVTVTETTDKNDPDKKYTNIKKIDLDV